MNNTQNKTVVVDDLIYDVIEDRRGTKQDESGYYQDTNNWYVAVLKSENGYRYLYARNNADVKLLTQDDHLSLDDWLIGWGSDYIRDLKDEFIIKDKSA